MKQRFVAGAALLLAAAQARAEGAAVGVYLPLMYFQDSSQKALFLTEVEKAITQALGESATASFASAPKQLATAPIWLVDAAEVVIRDGVIPVLRARGPQGKSAPVAVYARKSWSPPFELLLKGKLALPGGEGHEGDVLRFWLLLDEPRADQIVKNARKVRDGRAALAATAAGEADGAVALKADYAKLDPNLAALKEVTWLRELPLPILAVNAAAAGSKGDAWRKQLANAKLPLIPAMVSGWGAASSGDDDLAHLARVLKRRESAVSRELVLAPLPPLKADLYDMLPPPPEPEPLSPLIIFPKRRWAPLPDPPREPASPPAVSQNEPR